MRAATGAYGTGVRVDRRQFLGLLAATGGGTALLAGTGPRPASADQVLDVQLMQTAASVENLLVDTYSALLALPLFTAAAANPVLKALVTTARDQHGDHARACNDIATTLGGQAQTGLNGPLSAVVAQAAGGLAEMAGAVSMALRLETASMQTHQNAVALMTDVNARRLAAMIMAIEAQHVAVLRVGEGLATARSVELLSLATGAADLLPPGAGVAGVPDPFSRLDQARPPAEGAVP